VDERVLCAERRATAALGSYHVPKSECGEVRVVESGDVDTEAEETHGILERL
jgi:hypothetical protein